MKRKSILLIVITFLFTTHLYAETVYYTPSVNNLRLRKSPSIDGDLIRMLKKSEMLKLLEKGEEETIDNANDEVTALDIAVREDKKEIIPLLKELGAKLARFL